MVCPSAGSTSAERRAVIPMQRGIDSLNVAAATARRLLRRSAEANRPGSLSFLLLCAAWGGMSTG